MRNITSIAIHCSDTPDGDMTWDVNRLRKLHKEERGFSDIAYHFVILPNGTIQMGRPIEVPGAHVKGHNSNTVGLCWVGRNLPSDAQITALVTMVQQLMGMFKNLTIADVRGHHEFLTPGSTWKSCPNMNMVVFRGFLRNTLPVT